MRIISQDGIDFPYEQIAISNGHVPRTNKYTIYAHFTHEENASHLLAAYSSEEKVKKAMDMLHEAYIGLPYLFQNVNISEDVADIFQKHGADAIVARTDDAQPKVEQIGNTIFHFPQDDEIES